MATITKKNWDENIKARPPEKETYGTKSVSARLSTGGLSSLDTLVPVFSTMAAIKNIKFKINSYFEYIIKTFTSGLTNVSF